MSQVIIINVDGKDREVTVLDTAAYAYGVGTSLVKDLVLENPSLTTNSKVAVNIGNTKNIVISGTINIVQDEDKFRAVVATAGGWYTGEVVGSIAAALARGVAISAAAGAVTLSK